jgi:hypothetical protein
MILRNRPREVRLSFRRVVKLTWEEDAPIIRDADSRDAPP